MTYNAPLNLHPTKAKKLVQVILDSIEFKRNKPKKYIPLKEFKKLHGKLQFATVSLALGKPLMDPFDNALCIAQANNCSRVIISSELHQALTD